MSRLPDRLTLIPAGAGPGGAVDLRHYATSFDLAMAIAQLLDGAELVLTRSMASYPGFDTFPAFSVHALSAPGETGARTTTWLCAVYLGDLSPEALDAAVTEAQARLRMRAA